jgi:hypothetical protein
MRGRGPGGRDLSLSRSGQRYIDAPWPRKFNQGPYVARGFSGGSSLATWLARIVSKRRLAPEAVPVADGVRGIPLKQTHRGRKPNSNFWSLQSIQLGGV